MIYSIEYAKLISQIEESLNDCPTIFPLIYIPELCCEALCFCLGEVHSSYEAQWCSVCLVRERQFQKLWGVHQGILTIWWKTPRYSGGGYTYLLFNCSIARLTIIVDIISTLFITIIIIIIMIIIISTIISIVNIIGIVRIDIVINTSSISTSIIINDSPVLWCFLGLSKPFLSSFSQIRDTTLSGRCEPYQAWLTTHAFQKCKAVLTSHTSHLHSSRWFQMHKSRSMDLTATRLFGLF